MKCTQNSHGSSETTRDSALHDSSGIRPSRGSRDHRSSRQYGKTAACPLNHIPSWPRRTSYFPKKRAHYHPPKFASSRAPFSSQAEGAATRTKIASPHQQEGQLSFIKHLSKVTSGRMVSVRQSISRDRLAPTWKSACFSMTPIARADRVITVARASSFCHSKFCLSVFEPRWHTRRLQRGRLTAGCTSGT